MAKVTKKALMIEALNKYTPKQIENAEYCEMNAVAKDGNIVVGCNFHLRAKDRLSKYERILKTIRSALHNTTPDESNKRPMVDTSSENIRLISIKLK
ncbi:MAG: hypothetical protein HHAS10_06260 [Candidatus Altimarinota bacterium]